jgi:GAF domain-containing protein
MTTEPFLNRYHNASTPPSSDVPPELASFMLAADPVLAEAAELARVVAQAHQGAATQLIGEGWAHARKYFSLSEKYADWADYRVSARGFGIHAYAHEVSKPIRLTDEELRAHDRWTNFGPEIDNHPPMRGWLAVPLIGGDGVNYGFIQVTDRLEGEFNEQDEANLVRLATLTSAALDALADSSARLSAGGGRAVVWVTLARNRANVARLKAAAGSTTGAPTDAKVRLKRSEICLRRSPYPGTAAAPQAPCALS